MLLSIHPDVVKRLRDEHSHVFGDDIMATVDMLRESPFKLNELDYTTAVIKETLRMYPVGFSVRAAAEE